MSYLNEIMKFEPSYADKLSNIAHAAHKPEMKANNLSFVSDTAFTNQEISVRIDNIWR